jgi:hypothetical protein
VYVVDFDITEAIVQPAILSIGILPAVRHLPALRNRQARRPRDNLCLINKTQLWGVSFGVNR